MMESVVKLSKRLTAITEFVSKEAKVADIGCDHGFVSIYLVQTGIASCVIASDVNEGPLLRAKEHVSEYGLEEQIELRLADGMNALTAEDQIDCAVIAGMGGRMMIHILTDALSRSLIIKELVLQPQSEWQELRIFLKKQGYEIIFENMILEDGKFYPVMKVAFRQSDFSQISSCESCEINKSEININEFDKEEFNLAEQTEYAYGPCLLRDKHPVLKAYIEKELAKFIPILKSLPPDHKSYSEVTKKVQLLEKANELLNS